MKSFYKTGDDSAFVLDRRHQVCYFGEIKYECIFANIQVSLAAVAQDCHRGVQCDSRLGAIVTEFYDGHPAAEGNDGRGRPARLGRQKTV